MENKYSQLTTQTMSHELMTPLNSITNLSEMSLKSVSGMISHKGRVLKIDDLIEIRQFLQVVYTSSQHMFIMIKSQLEVQHIKQKSTLRNYEEVLIKDEIYKVFSLVEAQA